MLSTRDKVVKPEDIAGKTIRTYSKGASELLQAVGASPVTMGVGDVYAALQRGAVDGALGGIQGAVGLKHYEVTKFVMVPNGLFGTLVHGYVMNKDKWNSLYGRPAQDRPGCGHRGAQSLGRLHDRSPTANSCKCSATKVWSVTEVKPGTDIWKPWQAKLDPLAERDRKRYPAELIKLLKEAK